MRIVFMGNPKFSVGIVSYLLQWHKEGKIDLVGVVTRPDRPEGRGRKLSPSDVKAFLTQNGYDSILETSSVKSQESLDVLYRWNPDLIIVAAFGQILSSSVLEVARQGSINVHTSILPALRGAAPIQRSILEGLKVTGVTIMKMELSLDAGDILAQASCEIDENDTAGDLEEKLIQLSEKPLYKVIHQLKEVNHLTGKVQDINQVTWADKVTKEEAKIDWNRSAIEVHRLICGMDPKPFCFSYLKVGGLLKRTLIAKSRLVSESISKELSFLGKASPGQVVIRSGRTYIATGQGFVEIDHMKPEGKRWMNSSDFIRGLKSDEVIQFC